MIIKICCYQKHPFVLDEFIKLSGTPFIDKWFNSHIEMIIVCLMPNNNAGLLMSALVSYSVLVCPLNVSNVAFKVKKSGWIASTMLKCLWFCGINERNAT